MTPFAEFRRRAEARYGGAAVDGLLPAQRREVHAHEPLQAGAGSGRGMAALSLAVRLVDNDPTGCIMRSRRGPWLGTAGHASRAAPLNRL